MRNLARVAVLAATPLLTASAVALGPPALADSGGCLWEQTIDFVPYSSSSVTPAGGTVTVNGVIFGCSTAGSTSAPQYNWTPEGTTANPNTSGLVSTGDSTSNASLFSPGAVLDGSGTAWSLGSFWANLGSFSTWTGSLTQCVDNSCDPNNPGGGVPPLLT